MSNNVIKKYVLGSIYIPCNFPSQNIEKDLNTICQLLENYDGSIIGGDLDSKNPDWGDSCENSNGRLVKKWLDNNSMDVLRLCDSTPSFPSRLSYLDHFLISKKLIDNNSRNFSISSLPTFSDHFPLRMKQKLETSEIVIKPPLTFTSYKHTNWNSFPQDMTVEINRITPPMDSNLDNESLDTIIKEFNNSFTAVHANHSRRIEIKMGNFQYQKKLKS